ncbi:RagB/SusD family nutrient uptake outer membrane protein [Dysgonomonas sp. GY617]|uniref:RagB/SusD family nutrient uptake outer membrane protein n=1 Tax=Dysgonomonas sp. GY617 TaxID=2780420 RepID=UPI0018846F12|nr:RagB/SusD family nutrient uptake outer membrane protein [Dysgonomonas sp. GY617]MBF0577608.1 RagB/SusD family nutrient uptake outer membrane protein [Dysgonomonas sp. GY617]
MKLQSFKYICTVVLMGLLFTSCLDDLNTEPLNKKKPLNTNVYTTVDGYRGVLAKCYGSLILNGQDGPDKDGDVGGMDTGYSGYTRSLFYLQECSTDEIVLHSGSSQGSWDLLFMNWNASTKIISYSYYRLFMSINYCNEFLRESTDSNLKSRGLYEDLKDEMPYYRAEARFIRAYCYSMICDLYGSAPFVDETMAIGTIPQQSTRENIYNYVVAETEALAADLKAPGTNQYGRIDQAAAWFLLSRVYLNAEAWVGKKEYEKAYQYSKKIIDSNTYPLASDYRHIFLADNNTCKEIIWNLPQDGVNTINSAGTNFILKALTNGSMNVHTGLSSSWGNARIKTQLVDMFDVSDQTFDEKDTWGDKKKDKRAQFYSTKHTKETWIVGSNFQATKFENGYATIKWRNMTKDRKPLEAEGTTYSSIDYPMFRTADAYLMAAEAVLRGASGSRSDALKYVNEIRDRAYMSGAYGDGVSGRINDSQLTLDFILDERARELHTELVRRTDLIRFNKFTKGYNWDWKGGDGSIGAYVGKDVDDKYNLFPIPQDEFSVNPYLTQNPDYSK